MINNSYGMINNSYGMINNSYEMIDNSYEMIDNSSQKRPMINNSWSLIWRIIKKVFVME